MRLPHSLFLGTLGVLGFIVCIQVAEETCSVLLLDDTLSSGQSPRGKEKIAGHYIALIYIHSRRIAVNLIGCSIGYTRMNRNVEEDPTPTELIELDLRHTSHKSIHTISLWVLKVV